MNSPTNMPPPISRSDEKLWIVLSHLSVFLGVGILLPLIVYLVKKDESPAIAFHAKEALNFHLSVCIYALVCLPLLIVIIGFPLLIGLGITTLVFAIVAAVQGADGREYRYPLTIRFIR